MFCWSRTNPLIHIVLYRHYIAECRKIRPVVPPAMSEYIVNSYVQMRKQQKEEEAEEKFNSYVSARTLLGVLRLSQALARLRMDSVVSEGDVNEALRLMEVSKSSLSEHQANRNMGEDQTEMSKIFRIIKDMASAPRAARTARRTRGRSDESSDDADEDLDELNIVDIRARVLAKGFTETALMETIMEVCTMINSVAVRLLIAWPSFTVREHGRLAPYRKRISYPFR